MRKFLSLAIVALLATPALAAPTVDGTKVGDAYGDAIKVQTVETQFGDNFSEWNAGYGVIDNGTLHLMFTGNLEGNFNKLELFLDTAAGGSNVINSIGNDGAGNMNGMTLDAAFAPEYHLIFRRGGTQFDVDLATLNSGAGGSGALIIDGQGGQPGSTIFGAGNSEGSASGIGGTSLAIAYDGNNVAGIDGCDSPGGTGCEAADQAAAELVDTGLELSIDLSDLGVTGNGPIGVMLLQNNQDHGFLSNQSLGGLPVGFGNLGSPSGADFSSFDGDQFFTVGVPEPTTVVLAGLASLGLLTTRRRS